jgi:hypothetical protein
MKKPSNRKQRVERRSSVTVPDPTTETGYREIVNPRTGQ